MATDRWPVTGLPPNPGMWITKTARNRAVDHLRRGSHAMTVTRKPFSCTNGTSHLSQWAV